MWEPKRSVIRVKNCWYDKIPAKPVVNILNELGRVLFITTCSGTKVVKRTLDPGNIFSYTEGLSRLCYSLPDRPLSNPSWRGTWMVNRIPVEQMCLLFAHRSTGNAWDIQDIVLPQKLTCPLKNSGLSRLPSFWNGPFSTAGNFLFWGVQFYLFNWIQSHGLIFQNMT